MKSTRIDATVNSASDEVTFPFSDLIEDIRHYIYSKFPILSTSGLMQARRVNKEFSVGATRALFYKNNRSALFAQSVMLKQKYELGSFAEIRKQELLALLSRPVASFNEQTMLLATISKLSGVRLGFSVEESERFSALLIKRASDERGEFGDNFLNQAALLLIASNVSSLQECLAVLMRYFQVGFENQFLDALAVFSLAIYSLDQDSLFNYLEHIREEQSGLVGARGYSYEISAIRCFSSMLKNAAKKLNPEKVQPHAMLLMTELENSKGSNILLRRNMAFLNHYADKLDTTTIHQLAACLIKRTRGYSDLGAGEKYAVLCALRGLVNTNKLQKWDLKNCLDIVIAYFATMSALIRLKDKEALAGRHEVFADHVDNAALSLVRDVAQKIDETTLFSYLEKHALDKVNINTAVALSPTLSVEKVNHYVPLIINCLEKKEGGAFALLFLRETWEKIEPTKLDDIVKKILTYFDDDYYIDMADKWFLSCQERLSSAHYNACKEALLLSIYSQTRDDLAERLKEDLHFRIQRMASVFSSEEAATYLPILLAYFTNSIKSPSPGAFHSMDNPSLAALQAIAERMSDADLRKELPSILKLFPNDDERLDDVPIHFFSGLILRGVCNLETLNNMLLPLKFNSDQIFLLKKVADWSAALRVSDINMQTMLSHADASVTMRPSL